MTNVGFPSTQWSLISQARQTDPAAARQSLHALCKLYWYPLYSWLRRRGYNQADAGDSLQTFFVDVLDSGMLERASSDRGRFRNYLLAALRFSLNDQHDRATAAKRGGGQIMLDLEDAEHRYGAEDSSLTPEELYARQFALSVLQRVEKQLETTYKDQGKERLFSELRPTLLSEAVPHATIAQRLSMTPGAVKVAAHRLRKRYGEQLRRTVADLVEDPDLVQQELQDLMNAVAAR